MKIARFQTSGGRIGWGWVDPDNAQIVREALGPLANVFPDDLIRQDIGEVVAQLQAAEFHAHALPDLKLLAPIAKPAKLIAVGRNYRQHAAEGGNPVPEAPMLFGIMPSAITGPFDEIEMPADTGELDWEGELGVVIGRTARHVSRADALSVIAGYVGVNDISARDMQRKDVQWMRAKSFDTFKPMGPYLTTVDEMGLATDTRISVRVSGVQKQNESTAMMVFPVDFLIEYITAFCTLEAGDIIATGTPSGVGMGERPQSFLKPGDLIETEIAGIGRMANRTVSRPSLVATKAKAGSVA
jgi:2-keto-4-pentenoate hydratase/2-oxohepta-3-ene-1,7-dioic acid hydratase in catechol pathway